jgi:hypothetical protein
MAAMANPSKRRRKIIDEMRAGANCCVAAVAAVMADSMSGKPAEVQKFSATGQNTETQ